MPSTHVERTSVFAPHASSAAALAAAAGIVPVAALTALSPLAHFTVALSLGAIAGAAIASLVASLTRVSRDGAGIQAWDVAGILAFIGFGAGMVAGEDNVLKFLGLS